MALKPCPHCGKKITAKTDTCPYCDGAIKKKKEYGCGTVFLIVFGILVVIGVFINQQSPPQKQPTQPQPTQPQPTQPQPTQPQPTQPPQPTATPDPLSSISGLTQVNIFFEISDLLENGATEEKKQQIRDKYNITDEQYATIQQKGLSEDWQPLPTPTPTPTVDPKAERKKRIERQFSAWDGHHYKLTEHVKNAMHDPDSFEHIETRIADSGGNTIKIKMDFRGKNQFGALVKNTVFAEVDLDGNILSVEQGQ